jgi:arsenical pump membrane protein
VRAGWFERLAAQLPLTRPRVAVAWVIVITALISGLINLDVAVVVGMPLALTVAAVTGVSAGWLAIGVANVANAASFLLPTSNLTNLLVMGSRRIGPVAFLSASWPAWSGVVAVTTVAMVVWAGRSEGEPGVRPASVEWSLRWLLVDLAAMFFIASGLRAFLTGGITLPGGFALQMATGGALASVFNNLPAAALVHAGTGAGPWPAILAMGAGSNLLITGSVATVICRRLAREAGAHLSVLRLSAIGLTLLPMQIAAAYLGLRLTHAI